MNNEEIRKEEFEVQDISTNVGDKSPSKAAKVNLNNNADNEVTSNENFEVTSSIQNIAENKTTDKLDYEVVEPHKKKKKNKEKWKVWDIISTVLVSIFTVFVVYQLVLKFTGFTPNLFGYRTDVVLTDSMSVKNEKHEEFLEGYDNQLQPYDLVVSKLIDENTELNVYDIVIFDSPIFGETIHRIVDVSDEGGVVRYQIRGDKAETSDGWFIRDTIIAKYEFSIPKIGVVFSYLQSFYGIITIIGVVFIISIFTYLRDLPEKPKKIKPPRKVIRYFVYVKNPKQGKPVRLVLDESKLKEIIEKRR